MVLYRFYNIFWQFLSCHSLWAIEYLLLISIISFLIVNSIINIKLKKEPLEV